jgi:ABC-2 type transport system ATP-binding protein
LQNLNNPISPMTLTIKDVSKTYGNGVHALNNVALTVPRGMFGLLGPNGAGKSTLMRILATLQQPDHGDIQLHLPSDSEHPARVIDVIKEKGDMRKTLGYLPQDFGVYPRASAMGLLEHFAILKGYHDRKARKAVVESLLKKTNLWDVRKQKLGGYSGGMLQRFGIAVALLGDPQLLIVDEPTAGLDPAERVRFLNLLSELGENSVVILSTHIVEDVRELCSHMAVIDRGEILLQAQPLEATQHLKGKIWRQTIDKSALPALSQTHAVISTKLFAGKTIVHIYSDQPPGNGFEWVEPDLQDVYFCAIAGHIGNRKRVMA